MSSSCWVSCQISRLISSGCNIFKLYCRKGKGLYFCLKPQHVEIKYLLTVRLWWDCVVPLFAASFTEKMTQSASMSTVSDRNALGEDAGFVWNGSQRWDGIELRGAHGGENAMERGNPLQGPARRSLEGLRRAPGLKSRLDISSGDSEGRKWRLFPNLQLGIQLLELWLSPELFRTEPVAQRNPNSTRKKAFKC